MPSIVALDIDDKKLSAVAKTMAATEQNVTKAHQRALTKVSRWVMTHLARELSKDTEIPLKIIKKRLKKYISQDKLTAKVWLGLAPISGIHLKPKQTYDGVTAGGRHFNGAFIANARKGQQIFARRGKSRLPIEKQTISIEREADTAIESVILPHAETRLISVFTQELRWLSNQSR